MVFLVAVFCFWGELPASARNSLFKKGSISVKTSSEEEVKPVKAKSKTSKNEKSAVKKSKPVPAKAAAPKTESTPKPEAGSQSEEADPAGVDVVPAGEGQANPTIVEPLPDTESPLGGADAGNAETRAAIPGSEDASESRDRPSRSHSEMSSSEKLRMAVFGLVKVDTDDDAEELTPPKSPAEETE